MRPGEGGNSSFGGATLRVPEVVILFRSRHRLIAYVLSLALVIAQLGMTAHAYSHLNGDSDSLPSQVQSCAQCLSFTPLLGMAGSSPDVGPIRRIDNERIVLPPANPIVGAFSWPAFRSRAPPAVL
jgi:hypothetical protein